MLPYQGRPMLIRFCFYSMLSAVQLYDQPLLEAAEVDDKFIDRILPAKLRSGELARTQSRPEFLFHIGLISPQLTRSVAKDWQS